MKNKNPSLICPRLKETKVPSWRESRSIVDNASLANATQEISPRR